MVKRGKRAPTSRARTPLLVAAAVGALLLAGAAVFAMRGGGDEAHAGHQASFGDAHGLAVHPTDPDVVFVATHRGLFRGGEDGFARVGEGQDDLMGFSLHPTDPAVAWSSGHPGPGGGGPGNLGVRLSLDGGATWESLALPGVDFHAMAVSPADPDRLWGHWQGEVRRSLDGGKTWESASRLPRVTAFAGSPTDPDVVWAATGAALLRSDDGGRSWSPAATLRAYGVAVAPDGGTLHVATGEGVARSTDGGATWTSATPEAGKANVAHVAVSPSRPTTVYAATYDAAVYRSLDGGETWQKVKAPG